MQTLNYNIDMTDDSIWDIVTVDQFSRENLLYLQEVGLFDSGPKYYTVREGLDSYYLSLTLSGQGVMEYDGKKIYCPEGSFYWIDCRKHQKYYTDPAVGHWKALWIHFYGVTAESYYNAYLAETLGNIMSPLKDSKLYDLFYSILKLANNYTSDVRCGIECSSCLTQLLCSLITTVHPDSSPEPPKSIVLIRKYMHENFTEPITLDELSKEFSISKYHLQRQVKKYLGQTPAEYIINLRLTRSKELLRTTDLPVSEVAYSSGFNNVSYYIKTFHRMESVTPQQYRASWSTSGI